MTATFSRWLLVGDYGTFQVSRVVDAVTEEEAWAQTGICDVLELAGWRIDEAPDGEEWSVVPVGRVTE